MTVHPVHLFAVLGLGFGFARAVETGKEGAFLLLLAPAGWLWMGLFPRGLANMLGEGMLGAGPTMAVVVGARTLLDPDVRPWGIAVVAGALVELALGWWMFWPACCGSVCAAD